jgi:ubiquinone/menaquinone biosynthesis C-methylase UbiE
MFRVDLDTPALAEAYQRASPLLFLAGKRLVHALGVAQGHHVIDVGCGTGVLAEYVSRLVGAEGLVVGIDPLERRIAIAQQRQRSNLRFQVGTALDLSAFPAGRFDAAYMHLVFHWLPDKIEPLRQVHRLLKPGARLGLTTSAGECENTLQTACADLFAQPPYDAYRERWNARSRPVSSLEVERLLHDTGFAITRLEVEPTTAHWPTAEEAIAFSETISAGNLFGHLPEALRPRARVDLAATLERFRHQDMIRIEGARILAIATIREGVTP